MSHPFGGQRYDVVVLGDLNPDLVLTGDVVPRFGQAEQLLDDAQLLVGGSGAITAHGLARLGTGVALVAQVGDDAFGDLMIAQMQQAGVDTDLVRRGDLATGMSVVLSTGATRTTLTHVGAIDAEPPPWHQPDDVPSASLLHVTSFYLQSRVAAVLPRLLTLARAAGLQVSLDTNLDPAGEFAGLADLLPLVDLLLPNAVEACAMAAALGHPRCDVDCAATVLARHGPTVVVKDGERGAVLAVAGREPFRAVGRPIVPVDTTGAGDSFNAAFLAARVRGLSDVEALRWGNAAGRLATTRVGGTAGQPTEAELAAELRAAP
jgi:ribokinase